MKQCGYGFVVESTDSRASEVVCKGVLETVNNLREHFITFLEKEATHAMAWGIENDGVTVDYIISRMDS